MGIDFSHGDAHWSYGGFNKARVKLAKKVGIDLDKMKGFTDTPEEGISWEMYNDPIIPLLKHSDCDGELSINECNLILPRLVEIISTWGNEEYDKIHFIKLIEGMEEAVKKNESFGFR